jgi:hypothetical protein
MESQQNWFRVFGFMPVGKPAEERAAAAVLNWLRLRFPGYTASATNGTAYQGFYRRADGSWCFDPLSIVFVDDRFQDVSSLDEFVEEFGKVILLSYEQFNCHQDEAMVAAHTLTAVRLFGLPEV